MSLIAHLTHHARVLHTSITRPLCLLFCHISFIKQHILSLKCFFSYRSQTKPWFRAPSPLHHFKTLSSLRSSLSPDVSVFPLAVILQCCWSLQPSGCSGSSWRIPLGSCRSLLSVMVSCERKEMVRNKNNNSDISVPFSV